MAGRKRRQRRKRTRSNDTNQLPISKKMSDLQIRPEASLPGPNLDAGMNVENQQDRSDAGPSSSATLLSDDDDIVILDPPLQRLMDPSDDCHAGQEQQPVPAPTGPIGYESQLGTCENPQANKGMNVENQQDRSDAGPSSSGALLSDDDEIVILDPPLQQLMDPSDDCHAGQEQQSVPAPTGPNVYQPELSACENPHYYQANKVLFEAHMQNVHHHSRKK